MSDGELKPGLLCADKTRDDNPAATSASVAPPLAT